MATLDELAAYLEAQSVGVVDTDIFVGAIPKTPGDCLVLIETGGQGPEHFFGEDSPALERPSVQVLSKHINRSTARSKLRSAWDALAKVGNQSLSSTRYMGVFPFGALQQLPADDSGRYRYVANFLVWKEPS